jgi:carbonic anhydrase
MNYDIKVPGEHTIEGESFDAEIQMLHIHPTADRTSSIGVPVRAREDGYNVEFQKIINAFQQEYDAHALECAQRTKRRNLRYFDLFEDEEMLLLAHKPRQSNRQDRFNPYADALMPTIFFYRYDGSITEPPCKDITWWVMMEPMIISLGQLNQVKKILFTHVDADCDHTSVHNDEQSVARPIYPLGTDREIQKCSVGSYVSDVDKGRPEGKQCRN